VLRIADEQADPDLFLSNPAVYAVGAVLSNAQGARELAFTADPFFSLVACEDLLKQRMSQGMDASAHLLAPAGTLRFGSHSTTARRTRTGRASA
jgi:hypothetical protein